MQALFSNHYMQLVMSKMELARGELEREGVDDQPGRETGKGSDVSVYMHIPTKYPFMPLLQAVMRIVQREPQGM